VIFNDRQVIIYHGNIKILKGWYGVQSDIRLGEKMENSKL
jgi:hypothetical protein